MVWSSRRWTTSVGAVTSRRSPRTPIAYTDAGEAAAASALALSRWNRANASRSSGPAPGGTGRPARATRAPSEPQPRRSTTVGPFRARGRARRRSCRRGRADGPARGGSPHTDPDTATRRDPEEQDAGLAAPRGVVRRRSHDGVEDRDLLVQVRRWRHVPVREPRARPVLPDHPEPGRQPLCEGAERGVLPVELEVAAPPPPDDERGQRRRTQGRPGHARPGRRGEPDLLLQDRRIGPGMRKGPDAAFASGPLAGTASGHLVILVTRPAPTVRPPSRIAKRRPSSMAIGWMSSTDISVVSPGMTISVPSGSLTTPVTSVVRK